MHAFVTILIALLLLGFPPGAAAQKGLTEDTPDQKAGAVPASESFAMPDLPGQEKAAELKKQYAAAVRERMSEIRMAIDPTYIEQLQKEIAELKTQEEKAQMELQLEFALQKGDEKRAVYLQKQLNFFYREKDEMPADEPPKQVPGMLEIRQWSKNPDDR